MSSVWRRAGLALVAAAAVIALGACQITGPGPSTVVQGSGIVGSEIRAVDPFTKVEVRRGIVLRLTVGSPQRVEISAPENLLPMTTTTVRDGLLIVDATHDFTCPGGIVATVSMPAISELALVGGASGRVIGIDATTLAIRADSGANLSLSGRADWLSVTASGGSGLDLGDFEAADATVHLDSGVVARIGVTDSISGSVTDGVVLTVYGGAQVMDVSVTDDATVIRE